MPSVPKEKGERVRDAIEILKQLKEVGIPDSDPGYIATKKVLDAWILDGEARQEKIPFPRALRVGHMLLPRLAGRQATFVLKATDELKEMWAREERASGKTN
jgi:hypothetical protein